MAQLVKCLPSAQVRELWDSPTQGEREKTKRKHLDYGKHMGYRVSRLGVEFSIIFWMCDFRQVVYLL